jgi:hypothetical protein
VQRRVPFLQVANGSIPSSHQNRRPDRGLRGVAGGGDFVARQSGAQRLDEPVRGANGIVRNRRVAWGSAVQCVATSLAGRRTGGKNRQRITRLLTGICITAAPC